MIQFWMVWRYLHDGRKYLSLPFILSVLGVTLGVAALVIAMAVVSGYESTLRDSVINMQGHMVILKTGGVDKSRSETEDRIQKILPEMQALTPFVYVEGLIIHKKKLSGIVLEGIAPGSVEFVLSMRQNLAGGVVEFSRPEELKSSGDKKVYPKALIGKGIASKFGIQAGEEIALVIPVSRSSSVDGFKPKMQRFVVSGILDLGRKDYDERYIVTDLESAQKFGEVGSKISGWRVRLKNYSQADAAAQKIDDQLGSFFVAKSWTAMNKNLFQAVYYERMVIFIIVSMMLIAAAFNVSSTLFLSVVRRYSQISILKTMGVSHKFVRQLFTRQGLIVGFLGVFFGFLLGRLGCFVFIWAEKKWGLFPGDVYKLDHVNLEIRMIDLAFIFVITLVICYISTLAPANRGAKLMPVEGLRYE